MRFSGTIAVLLLAGIEAAFGQDQSRPATQPPRSRPAAPVAEAPRPATGMASRPSATLVNPYFRRLNPNAAAMGDYRGAPSNSYRFVPRGNANARAATGQFGHSLAQTGTATAVTRGSSARIPPRAGNELSFAQARAQCTHDRHDRDWWRHHHVPVVFYGGGYWYWNGGWWFPAWGYDPYYSNYVYDGPIYGFGEMSPGNVTSQVQQALAQQGYYDGPIDGILGPETRDAILRFQADHGLAPTAAIDEPTLDSLGLT